MAHLVQTESSDKWVAPMCPHWLSPPIQRIGVPYPDTGGIPEDFGLPTVAVATSNHETGPASNRHRQPFGVPLTWNHHQEGGAFAKDVEL